VFALELSEPIRPPGACTFPTLSIVDTATAALIVAICSATVTLTGLLWQIALYRLQGARLKVQIAFCYRSDTGMTITLTGPGRRAPTFEELQRDHIGLWYGIEYGLVRVTNIGRTAVSVENIAFDFGQTRRLRRGRTTVVPMQFRDPDSDAAELDLRVPHRIEPGANITVPFMLWPVLTSQSHRGHRGDRDLIVRGSATSVGRRTTRSSRRSAWRIPKGALSRFADLAPPPPDMRVYRVLWNAQGMDYVGSMPLLLHFEIVEQLREGASIEQIKKFLDDHNPGKAHQLLAWEAHQAYHSTAPTPFGDVEQPCTPGRSWRQRTRRVLFGIHPDGPTA